MEVMLTGIRIIHQMQNFFCQIESPEQTAVVNNFIRVNATVLFSARGSLSELYDLAVSDDFVSREYDEVFDITVLGSSRPADISTIGTTTITIVDEDSQFFPSSNNYSFSPTTYFLL